jgi:hypothetical protein
VDIQVLLSKRSVQFILVPKEIEQSYFLWLFSAFKKLAKVASDSLLLLLWEVMTTE